MCSSTWEVAKKASLHDLAVHDAVLLGLQRYGVTPYKNKEHRSLVSIKTLEPSIFESSYVNVVKRKFKPSPSALKKNTSGTPILPVHTVKHSTQSDILSSLIVNFSFFTALINSASCRVSLRVQYSISEGKFIPGY